MHWNLIKKPFSVSFDLTPYQREQFKVLKNQADAFNAEHDTREEKMVVHFDKGNIANKGYPRILKIDFEKKNKKGNKSKK